MTSEHYVAHHSKSQSAAKTVSLVYTPEAMRDQHEEHPNLWLVWSFLLRHSTQLANRPNRDCQQRAD